MSELRCGLCDCDLSVRPVLRDVRKPGRPANFDTSTGIPTPPLTATTYQKRVRMKPAQVVISCRVEGSFGLGALPGVDFEAWEARVCGECLRGRTFAEVLAVVLDRRLERGG